MKKSIFAVTLVCFSGFCLAETVESIHKGKKLEVSGFECAQRAMQVMDLLGRGPDFPGFLIADVEKELDRQHKGSQLISITCTGEPELKAGSIPLANDDTKSVLSRLSLGFPLELVVSPNGKKKNKMTMTVEQNYFVENLDKDNQAKVTQRFIVKK